MGKLFKKGCSITGNQNNITQIVNLDLTFSQRVKDREIHHYCQSEGEIVVVVSSISGSGSIGESVFSANKSIR